MNVLVPYVRFVVGIGPVGVHELDRLVRSIRIERVIVPQHKLPNLLIHKRPIDLESGAKRLIVV